ncbi:hypothetical protein F383_20475 [Gossypium arboreum]|uniref:Uncharacterized protein n=1 Tax=Gossypium arboreum TaxID=29729 RepID=A0A0B0M9M1_GOSAR|nr:hypothetical protein F383_36680 [Gossypium arboreum]KHG13618.1 hypothetical protein F383_20475 [Gossypium arboreum]
MDCDPSASTYLLGISSRVKIGFCCTRLTRVHNR